MIANCGTISRCCQHCHAHVMSKMVAWLTCAVAGVMQGTPSNRTPTDSRKSSFGSPSPVRTSFGYDLSVSPGSWPARSAVARIAVGDAASRADPASTLEVPDFMAGRPRQIVFGLSSMTSAEPDAAEAELSAASEGGIQQSGQQHALEGIGADGVGITASTGEETAEPRSEEQALSRQEQREDQEQAPGAQVEATENTPADDGEQQPVRGEERDGPENLAADAEQEACHIRENVAVEDQAHEQPQSASGMQPTEPPPAQLPADTEETAVVTSTAEQSCTDDSAEDNATTASPAPSSQHNPTEQTVDTFPEEHVPTDAEGGGMQAHTAALIMPVHDPAGTAKSDTVAPSCMLALEGSTLPVHRDLLTSG